MDGCSESISGTFSENQSEIIEDLKKYKEVIFINDKLTKKMKNRKLDFKDIEEAQMRMERFAPYLMEAFPELNKTNGIIESPIIEIPSMKKKLEEYHGINIPGRLFLKCDFMLPVSGSIKARGGIYEVLEFAETVALSHGFSTEHDYRMLGGEKYKKIFGEYSLSVGSTGNLGLSVGIMGTKLGFKTHVHMSMDARQWKKDLLRSLGAHVTEYDSDYSLAVKKGREAARGDKKTHFVDDENSKTLFLGYSVAALRLKSQLQEMGLYSHENVFLLHLPCGVGGGPGGIAWGMKEILGDKALSFFAEPTHSPAMLLGLMTGLQDRISVGDIGIDNITEADGLAVGRPSSFVGDMVSHIIGGCFTTSDENMLRYGKLLYDSEGIFMEPSAQAGFNGPIMLKEKYSVLKACEGKNIIHIVWGTGGNMVPSKDREKFITAGMNLLKK